MHTKKHVCDVCKFRVRARVHHQLNEKRITAAAADDDDVDDMMMTYRHGKVVGYEAIFQSKLARADV